MLAGGVLERATVYTSTLAEQTFLSAEFYLQVRWARTPKLPVWYQPVIAHWITQMSNLAKTELLKAKQKGCQDKIRLWGPWLWKFPLQLYLNTDDP